MELGMDATTPGRSIYKEIEIIFSFFPSFLPSLFLRVGIA
jgi:hypothetical protein